MTAAEWVVRLVARTLPTPVRDRHREEWIADVTAAPTVGVSRASVVLGAAVFSILLDRDLPTVSGFAVAEQSRRYARWALALTILAGLVGLTHVPLAEIGFDAIPLAVVLALLAVVNLWAAARLSTGLARAAASVGTAGLLVFAAASTIPIVVSDAVPSSRYLPYGALALVVFALVMGLAVWVRGVRRGLVVALATACAVVAVAYVVLMFVSPVSFASPLPTLAVVVAVGVLVQVRGSASPAQPARGAIVASGALLALAVALTLFDQLVVTPLWMSGGDLAAAYAAPPAALALVISWAAAAIVVVVLYVRLAMRRTRGLDVGRAVIVAAALGASLLLTAGAAGSAWWMWMYGALPHAGPAPRLSLFLHVGGITLLGIAALGWIAPRSSAPREPASAR